MPALTLSPLGSEHLDDPAADPALVARMLADITTCNRWLGGRAVVRHALARVLRTTDRGRPLSLFDIGTGAADLPRDAQHYAARRGVTLDLLALERIPAAARIAHGTGVPVMLGCASALPLRPKSVDIVLVSQVAHHLERASVVQLFIAATAIARRAVIVADLRRGAAATLAFRAAGRILSLHPMTIDDGVTSLLRGYTVPELRGMCESAGAHDAQVATLPFSRVVAWWEPTAITDGLLLAGASGEH